MPKIRNSFEPELLLSSTDRRRNVLSCRDAMSNCRASTSFCVDDIMVVGTPPDLRSWCLDRFYPLRVPHSSNRIYGIDGLVSDNARELFECVGVKFWNFLESYSNGHK